MDLALINAFYYRAMFIMIGFLGTSMEKSLG